MYLGGPCYLRWRKTKNGFSGFWQPILYRAVRVSYDEAGFFRINPDQGNWDISPLVYQFLDAKNIFTEEPLEEVMLNIIEKVQQIASDYAEDLTDSLIDAIDRIIPELGEVLKAPFSNKDISKPSNWVLFTPAEASAITRNLVSDYNQLEKVLQEDAEAIGGLRLLMPGVNKIETQEPVPVLPIVPLNKNQQTAVEWILRKKPVTVISGPRMW